MKKILLIILSQLLCTAMLLQGQTGGIYVPKGGLVGVHEQDTVALFSNLTNEGRISTMKGSALVFFGALLRMAGDSADMPTPNTSQGNRSDGEGGLIIFQQPNPYYNTNQQQTLVGNYNAATRLGSSLPGVMVNNPNGLWLDSGSAHVREQLLFRRGRIVLNEQNLVLGQNNAGFLDGYNEERFIVTGTGRFGAFFIRDRIGPADSLLVYPIGADAASYTPLAFRAYGVGQSVAARVSSNVQPLLDMGPQINDSTVGRTWEILQTGNNPVSLDLMVQHLVPQEGAQFRQSRNQSFISSFVQGRWSRLGSRSAPLSPGTLTTGPAMALGGLNTTTLQLQGGGVSNYLTKFAFAPDAVVAPDTNRTRIVLAAERASATAVNTRFVTRPEVNSRLLHVQRRLGNTASFVTIASLPSRAPGGNSTAALQYTFNDLQNSFQGLSVYRIMGESSTGVISYSNEVVVGAGVQPPTVGINVWPVPTTGRFWIGINGALTVKSIGLYNAAGQLMRKIPVNGRNIIEMFEGVQGVYVLGFYGNDDKLITTKRLIVAN